MVGLSEVAKRRREHRNVVTMKFNLINYVVETVGVIMCLVVKNFFVDMLYLLFNWCSTPLVYYLGMEENRNKAEEYIRSNTTNDNDNIIYCMQRKSPDIMFR